MPEARAIVVMGVSGVGKTTVAEVLARRLELDVLRRRLVSSAGQCREDAQRHAADGRRPLAVVAGSRSGDRPASHGRSKGFVVACSALKRAYRKILMEERPDVRLVYLEGDHELIMSRLAHRQGHYFPATLLDSQFATLEKPDASERAITIVVDKDIGTVVDEIVAALKANSSS